MEFLVELIIELYGELVFGMIPEKGISRRARTVIKVVAALIFVTTFILAMLGVYYLNDGRMIGLLPIGIAAASLVAHIVFFVVARKRKR